MHCILIGPEHLTRYPALMLESADETWRCTRCSTLLPQPGDIAAADVALLFPGQGAAALLDALTDATPIPAPWLVSCGFSDPWCDAVLSADQLAQLPALIRSLDASGRLPLLCLPNLDRLTHLAAELLRALQIRPSLGAWRFLPRMLALVTLHPQLLSHITAALYPLVGAECGLSAAAVERSLRIAVESAWSTSPLIALERFFGQSIDPAKGKPTNREFLCQMSEHLRLAALADDEK